MSLKMPERQHGDGAVNITVIGEGQIVVTVTTYGTEHEIVMSEHNAWRVFGILSLILGIPLPSKIGKAIKLGTKLEGVVG